MGEVLALCRDVVGVFCSPSLLDQMKFEGTFEVYSALVKEKIIKRLSREWSQFVD